jgi:hypothetical protein
MPPDPCGFTEDPPIVNSRIARRITPDRRFPGLKFWLGVAIALGGAIGDGFLPAKYFAAPTSIASVVLHGLVGLIAAAGLFLIFVGGYALEYRGWSEVPRVDRLYAILLPFLFWSLGLSRHVLFYLHWPHLKAFANIFIWACITLLFLLILPTLLRDVRLARRRRERNKNQEVAPLETETHNP